MKIGNLFENHPVLGIVTGSIVLIGTLIGGSVIGGITGDWIAQGTEKLFFKK